MATSLVPELENVVEMGSVIGEGTFSTVYNGVFLSQYAFEAVPKRLAIKCITRIVEPQVLENELRCLTMLEGRNNVIRLLFAVRHNDCLSLVMPYFEHDKFCRLIRRFHQPSDIRDYMHHLLLAVSHIHSHNIIHRDIKPNNFLYSKRSGKCALVDFGLAQILPRSDKSVKCDTSDESRAPLEDITVSSTNTNTRLSLRDKPKKRKSEDMAKAMCNCHGQASVCRLCIGTPAINAARAGTAGYRPPEVLLKSKEQSTAVDMWACGVILLSILSGRSNFFNAPDDLTNLLQLVTLFGKQAVCSAAASMGKNLLVDLPGDLPNSSLKEICKELRLSSKNKGFKASKRSPIVFPESAYDLLDKLLTLNPADRITASEALKHQFIVCYSGT